MNYSKQLYQEQAFELNQKIIYLKKLLQRNRNAQIPLTNMKLANRQRLALIQQKMKNKKIYLERPIMKNVIAYLNFAKRPPLLLKEYEVIKNMSWKDSEIINKLNTTTRTEKRNTKSVKYIKATLNKVLSLNPKQINFVELAQLQSNIYKNGLERYKKWKKQFQSQEKTTPFSHNQQSLLIQKYNIYRDNWDKICNFFEGRDFQTLYYRYQYHSNKDFKKGRWSLTQNMKLIILVEHFGEKKWAPISKKMKDKSQIQVRERFCNILDPKISKNSWNNEQIRVLMEKAIEYDYQWSKLVQIGIFEGKTDNILWRKFRSLMILKSEGEIRSQIKDQGLAHKLVEIKKIKQRSNKRN